MKPATFENVNLTLKNLKNNMYLKNITINKFKFFYYCPEYRLQQGQSLGITQEFSISGPKLIEDPGREIPN